MKNSIIIHPNGVYSNPTLDSYIEGKDKEFIKEACLQGVTAAIKGVIQKNTSLSVITENILANYNFLIVYAHKHNEGFLTIAQGKLDIEKLQTECDVLLHSISEMENKVTIEVHRIGNLNKPSFPYFQIITVSIFGFLVLFMDAYFLGTAFQQTGSGLGISILLGLGISISIALISTLGTHHLQRIENPKKRLFLFYGLVGLVGSAVYVLCEMRNQFYHLQTGQGIGTFKLTLLSLLAFVAFHYLYKFLITPLHIQIKEWREAKKKGQYVKKLQSELGALHQMYSERQQKINEVKQFRLSILAYSKSLELSITRMYSNCIAQFKKSFIEQSGYIPPCFSEETPDLSHFYDSISITPNLHEKTKKNPK